LLAIGTISGAGLKSIERKELVEQSFEGKAPASLCSRVRVRRQACKLFVFFLDLVQAAHQTTREIMLLLNGVAIACY